MKTARRSVLKVTGITGMLAALGLSTRQPAFAQSPTAPGAGRTAGFAAQNLGDALKHISGNATITRVDSSQIQLQVPELAENGALVPLSVNSLIPGTTQIMLLIEKNPFPLVATFTFPEGTEPGVQTRVKMAQSSQVLAVVKAIQGNESRLYVTTKETRVTLGGCGA